MPRFHIFGENVLCGPTPFERLSRLFSGLSCNLGWRFGLNRLVIKILVLWGVFLGIVNSIARILLLLRILPIVDFGDVLTLGTQNRTALIRFHWYQGQEMPVTRHSSLQNK